MRRTLLIGASLLSLLAACAAPQQTPVAEQIPVRAGCLVGEPDVFCDQRHTAELQAAERAVLEQREATARLYQQQQQAAAEREAFLNTPLGREMQRQEAYEAAREAARVTAIEQWERQRAYQQQQAACTVAGDVVGLSINNLWGGLAAGLATSIFCMGL